VLEFEEESRAHHTIFEYAALVVIKGVTVGLICVLLPVGNDAAADLLLVLLNHVHVSAVFFHTEVRVAFQPQRIENIDPPARDWSWPVYMRIVVLNRKIELGVARIKDRQQLAKVNHTLTARAQLKI